MPLHSKAEMRKLFSLEGRGKLKKGTAEEFVKATPNLDKLPERIKKSKKLDTHFGKSRYHPKGS